MKEACREHQVDMVGGDTTSSLTGLVISITANGSVEKARQLSEILLKKLDLIQQVI